MKVNYPAVVHMDAGSDFGVSFPDFLGCVSAEKSLNSALAEAKEALQLHVDGMLEDGDALPVASDLAQMVQSSEGPGLVTVALVEIEIPGVSRRINITMDEALLAKVDRAAQEAGMSRSGMLAQGARMMLAATR